MMNKKKTNLLTPHVVGQRGLKPLDIIFHSFCLGMNLAHTEFLVFYIYVEKNSLFLDILLYLFRYFMITLQIFFIKNTISNKLIFSTYKKFYLIIVFFYGIRIFRYH